MPEFTQLLDAAAAGDRQAAAQILPLVYGELRKLAASEAVDYHGVLWMFDQLLTQQAVAAEMLHRSLTTVASHPRCRLPVREVRERLEHYARVMRGEA